MSAERWISAVAALIERADHPNTPKPEADAARAKAEDLMLRYSIEEADLLAVGGKAPGIVEVNVGMPTPYARVRWQLLQACAEPFGCVVVGNTPPRSNSPTFCTVIGLAADAERSVYLFESLNRHMDMELSRAYKDWQESVEFWAIEQSGQMTRGRKKVWMRSYMRGYASRVYERLMQKRRRIESAGTGLAVRDSMVDDWVAENMPHLRQTSDNPQHDRTASRYGHSAGGRAPIDTPIGQRPNKALG